MIVNQVNFKISVFIRVIETYKRVINSFIPLTFIGLCCFALLSTQTASADDFITQWTFDESRTEIVFRSWTNGPVEYSWTTSPSGNSGEGSFTAQFSQMVNLSDLEIEAGDVVTISMAPENLWRIHMSSGTDNDYLTDVLQWGSVEWATMEDMFWECNNLNISATDAPDLTNATSMETMFAYATSFNADINHWDVSGITIMEDVFLGASNFNGDISDWDVSNASTMEGMFWGSWAFNQDISNWDVSNVTDMSYTFQGATSFNQDISDWDVSAVTNMEEMFRIAYAYNQPLESWDVSNVTDMNAMFMGASSFNRDIGNWDVSSVTNISRMFKYTEAFNQDISSWDVSNVQYMAGTFAETDAFNQDIGNWDVSSAESMREMFRNASSFNQDIGDWDVSNVDDMNGMFREVTAFNQDLGNWDVSNVEGMWDMFHDASSFNQNLGSWSFNPNVVLISALDDSGLDCDNYSATLIGWYVNNPDVTDRTLGANDMEFGNIAAIARDSLIFGRGWYIGNDSPSNSFCGGILSNEEIEPSSKSKILIYPNPTQDRIVLKATPSELKRITVLNSQGKDVTSKTTMRDKSNGEKEIDLRLLNAGIYFVRTATTTEIVVKE